MRRFRGFAKRKQFFRMTDPEQAAAVSEWLGRQQRVNPTRNARGDTSED